MLRRRFHVGDLLAITTESYRTSPRGAPGMWALVRYMTRYAGFSLDDQVGCARDLRAAIMAAYPELGAYRAVDVPPPELIPEWLKRRERELGSYLTAPRLPPSHPVFTDAAEVRAPAGDGSADRRDVTSLTDGPDLAANAPGADPPASDAARERAAVPATGPRLRRRFHVGDLLAVTTGCPDIARRGLAGTTALVEYMADRSLTEPEVCDHIAEFGAALLVAYPELGAYTGADVPPRELLPLWLRRREREFGRYLPAPRLPPSHSVHASARPERAVTK